MIKKVKIKPCSLIFIVMVFYIAALSGGDSFVILPNGEQKILTALEPACFYTTENGEVTSVETLNLEEEIDIIVVFKGKPLCLQDKSIRSVKTMQMRADHNVFKSELSRLSRSFHKKIKKSSSLSQDYNIKCEYFQSFNGLAMRCQRGLMLMIRELPMVDKVYRDGEVRIHLETSVPQIRADRVRDELGLDGSGILVGVIDTGIDYMHPALGEGYGPGYRVIGGYDFANGDSDPMDDFGHGTHVAGIIGADSDELTGVAPGVTFLAVKAFDEFGRGMDSDIIAGIDYCLDPDGDPSTNDAVAVMNMSFGGQPQEDDPLDVAVNNASDAGVLSVAAAGNSGGENPFNSPYETIGSPGTAEKALTVGACDSDFNLADFSSKGPDPIHFRIKPELVAPGVNINSSVPNGGTGSYSGTSMATPHVAGVAALVKQLHPDWTAAQLKWAMVNSANPLDEEAYNAYEQGTGCVDAWDATQQEIIIQPGILSFGLVDLELDVWSDTLSFTVKNLGEETKDLFFTRNNNLPSGVTLSLNPAILTLAPGEEQEVTAEIAVPASVPVVNSEPFAYFGILLCASGDDTTNIPFGFTKANLLVIECDIPAYQIFLWETGTVHHTNIFTWPGQTKFYIRYPSGSYYVLAHLHRWDYYDEEDSTYTSYTIEKQDVRVGGLTYLTIDHSEAEFNAFHDEIYDINDNVKTDERLWSNLQVQVAVQVEDSCFEYNAGISADFTHVSKLDSSVYFSKRGLWGTKDDLTVLQMEGYGISAEDDLAMPSGSQNLTAMHVRFGDFSEHLTVGSPPDPKLFSLDEQAIQFNRHYVIEFSDMPLFMSSNSGIWYDKTDFSKISIPRMPAEFNKEEFISISLGSIRKRRQFLLGDIRTDEAGRIHIIERPGTLDPDRLITRCTVACNDTLLFDPGEDIYLASVEDICFSHDFLILDTHLRYSQSSFISPTGIHEFEISRLFCNQNSFDYYFYYNTQAIKMDDDKFEIYIYHPIRQSTFYRVLGNTQNYCLLGQNGHTIVDYYLCISDIPDNEFGWINSSNLDQLILLADGKPARWLRPGQDNQVRFLIYDVNQDVSEIQCYLIPSTGEKIELNLDIDAEKQEVFANIQDPLPHEFMDLQVVVSDSSDNRTSITAAPAFFYGNALDERVYDSRIYLYKYNLINSNDFPFCAGDTLSFFLNLTSNGNLAADSILIIYPVTSEFMPVNTDTVYVGLLNLGDRVTTTLDLRLLQNHTEDNHLVYTPEIHWKSNGKSYMREYSLLIKTQESGANAVDPENETAIPLSYKLYHNFPNPFNPSTRIHFQIPVEERVTVTIYNILGQQIRTLINQPFHRGDHQIVWDGTNEAGITVESGIYFCRMTAGNFTQAQKIVMMK